LLHVIKDQPEFSGSYGGGEYEDDSILGHEAV
jgi:hypothetical protein